jgi:hypothetical protein
LSGFEGPCVLQIKIIMKNIILCVFLMLFGSSSFAQCLPPVAWERVFGGDSKEIIAHHMFSGHDGHLLFTYRKITLSDTGNLLGWDTLWMGRLDVNGQQLWESYLSVPTRQLSLFFMMEQDSSYLLSGYSTGEYSRSMIAKISGKGDIEWHQEIPGPPDSSHGMIIDEREGAVYFLDQIYYDEMIEPYHKKFSDMRLLKMNEYNVTDTLFVYHAPYNELRRYPLVEPDGYVIPFLIDTNRTNAIRHSADNGFLKVDLDGSITDTFRIKAPPDTQYDAIGSVLYRSGRNYIYATGYRFNNIIDFEADYYAIKMDENFNVLKTKRYGGSGLDFIKGSIQYEDHIILHGISNSQDGDVQSTSDCYVNWIACIDEDLEIVWSGILGEPCKTELENFVESGDGHGLIGLGYWTDDDQGDNRTDIWAIKLDYPTFKSGDCGQLSLSPNPCRLGVLTVIAEGDFQTETEYKLYDAQGRILQDGTLRRGTHQQVQLPTGLATGVYWLSVQCSEGRTTKAVFVEND